MTIDELKQALVSKANELRQGTLGCSADGSVYNISFQVVPGRILLMLKCTVNDREWSMQGVQGMPEYAAMSSVVEYGCTGFMNDLAVALGCPSIRISLVMQGWIDVVMGYDLA